MDLGIAGKRALVCGASQGMGYAIARALAAEGVDLFICSRTKENLSALADEIEKEFGRRVFFEACDLSDSTSREALIDAVGKVFSGVDILIHNSGGPKSTRAEDTKLEDWLKGFEILFPAVAHLNEAFLPGMKERRWGRMVAVTSLSVMEPIPNLAISNAMRAAVTGMLKTLSDEVADHNICVNCVAPGLIHTARTDERIKSLIAQKGGTYEEHLSAFVQSVPAKRLGTPEEFAAVVAFLSSERASYITGSTICIDGGKRRSSF